MIELLRTRLKQGHSTIKFPKEPPTLPDRFRGRPTIASEKCIDGCSACADACPTGAILGIDTTEPKFDLGRCLFCADCAEACPTSAITHLADYSLSASTREELVISAKDRSLPQVTPLRPELLGLFQRSLKLREVSAGGCNGCESDINVLSTVTFDLGRFGIEIVASPRHADGLIITGPVSENMKLALLKTWEAVPSPKIVIAIGSCAIAGGPFQGHPEVNDGTTGLLPVNLFIPGCPPHPITILDGLLQMLDRRT